MYSDSVISKAVSWMSGEYIIERTMPYEFTECLNIEPIGSPVDDDHGIRVRMTGLLNDFKLREAVARETRDIKTILYARAFAADETVDEDDIHD